jgi:hypothetical protein
MLQNYLKDKKENIDYSKYETMTRAELEQEISKITEGKRELVRLYYQPSRADYTKANLMDVYVEKMLAA